MKPDLTTKPAGDSLLPTRLMRDSVRCGFRGHFKGLCLLFFSFCRQHRSWTGGQPGPAGGDHWLPDSATFLRPRVPLVFPQTPSYSWRGTGNRVRLRPLSPISSSAIFRSSSCNYELKAEGLTFSKCLTVVAVFGQTFPKSYMRLRSHEVADSGGTMGCTYSRTAEGSTWCKL